MQDDRRSENAVTWPAFGPLLLACLGALALYRSSTRASPDCPMVADD